MCAAAVAATLGGWSTTSMTAVSCPFLHMERNNGTHYNKELYCDRALTNIVCVINWETGHKVSGL